MRPPAEPVRRGLRPGRSPALAAVLATALCAAALLIAACAGPTHPSALPDTVKAAAALPPARSAGGCAPDAPYTGGEIVDYLVLTAQGAPLTAAAQAVHAVGARIVACYPQVGVVVARSQGSDVAGALRRQPGVVQVGRTSTVPRPAAHGAVPANAAPPPQAVPDPREASQWDMAMIGAEVAHARSLGSRDVVVGVIDTGVDDRNPDLAPNFDPADSVWCGGGSPVTTSGAWRPFDGAYDGYAHGTHVAGIIAAARNGHGVVGVAPGVRVASLKVDDTDGQQRAEALVCAYVWAGDHHLRVTNASLLLDPWLAYCPEDPDQAAVLTAVTRAVDYAANRGAVNVAAVGNSSADLAALTSVDDSPDDAPDAAVAAPRHLTADCRLLPVELPGVVAVGAVAADRTLAAYSNYGAAHVTVVAPGGGPGIGQPVVSAEVLSTVPLDSGATGWADDAGTSMAAPHVAGVVALLASSRPTATPTELVEALESQARPLPCPVTPPPNHSPCATTPDGTSYYGHGLVDAAAAVG